MLLFSHILTTHAQLGTQILPKETKKKIQIMQKKCMRFCLRLDKMQQMSHAKFRSINWLPTKERVYQCTNAITFKFVNKNCPFYLNEIFEFTPHCRIQEIVLKSRSALSERITRGRKPYRTLVPLCGTIYPTIAI